MTDARSKAVLGEMVPLAARSLYAHNFFTNLRAPLARGETIEVPSISALTVTADGSTGASPQAITTGVLSLTANLHPAIFAALPQLSQVQNMDGSWVSGVAMNGLDMLNNHVDELVLRTYVANELCWDTGASYIDNAAGDSLTDTDILACKAALLAQDGASNNLALFVSPFGEGSIAAIDNFVPHYTQAEQGVLGIPKIGSVHGVNVYTTNSVQRNKTVATTAAVTTGTGVTHTYTVASGHGLLAGELVTVSGHDADENVSAATAITSVTATTVVVTTAATTDGTSSDASGLITTTSSRNVMCDLRHLYVAKQVLPSIRVVPDYDSTDDAMQISTILGRIGRAGRARLLLSPGSSV